MISGEKAENGATLVTIQGAQALDLALALFGKFHHLTAMTTTTYPEWHVDDNALR